MLIGAFAGLMIAAPAARAGAAGSGAGVVPRPAAYAIVRDEAAARAGDADPRGYDARRGRCRSEGTGGAILGAIAGGLLGSIAEDPGAADPRGTAGVSAGRAIDRGC